MIDRVGLVAVALAAVAAHATALGGGYVWLDHAHLEEGIALAAPGDWFALFARGFAGTGFYRPLMALSLSLDAVVSKTPLWFHAVTLAWHALAAVLVTVLGDKLGCSRWAARGAGLLFAVHPATTLVASAIAFRSEAMATACLLGLLAAHASGRFLLAGAALLAGALSKETAWVLAPLLIATFELTRLRAQPPKSSSRARTRLFVSEALAFALASLLRWLYAPPFRATHPALSFDEATGTRLAALAKSARTLLFPLQHEICDAFPVTSTLSGQALGGVVVAAGLGLLTLRERRLGTWFLLALLPSLALVPLMRWWSPHYLYLPLAFGSLLLARAADAWGPRARLVVLCACAPLAFLSLDAGRRYADDAALWAEEVRRQPACREGQFYLGEVARLRGAWTAASERYARALHPAPGVLAYVDEGAAFQNLGVALTALGRFAEATQALRSALERSDDDRERRRIAHNLAATTLAAGDAAQAVRLLEPETARQDAFPESLLLQARALHALGRESEAVELLRRLGIAPNGFQTTVAPTQAVR